MKKEIKLSVDTREFDRLAIGARLYDALNAENENNLFRLTSRLYDSDNVNVPILGIQESDVINLIKLVNEKGNMRFPTKYVIIKE